MNPPVYFASGHVRVLILKREGCYEIHESIQEGAPDTYDLVAECWDERVARVLARAWLRARTEPAGEGGQPWT
jgi:hypothetical protein